MTTNNVINGASPNIAAHSLMLSQGASAQTGLLLTAGQVAIGTTSGDPSGATLSNGTNISITSASGSITINATGAASFTWVDQTSGTVTAAVNTGYVTDNGASLVTYTLPTTAALGTIIQIVGFSAGGWTIAQSSGQEIFFGNQHTTIGATGTLSSSNQYDQVTLVCVVANTKWAVSAAVGNLTYV
jgi:hypothetical protein